MSPTPAVFSNDGVDGKKRIGSEQRQEHEQAVGGNQTAPVLERLAKRIPAGQRFRPRIDVRIAVAFVFRPLWNKPQRMSFAGGWW